MSRKSISLSGQGGIRVILSAWIFAISFASMLVTASATSSSLKSVCNRFDTYCDQACYDIRARPDYERSCTQYKKTSFYFFCQCFDGTDVSATALQDLAGYEKVDKITVGTTTVRTSSTSFTVSYHVTTPVVTTKVRKTITSFTGSPEATSTVYVYKPKSHVGGDSPVRHAARSSTDTGLCGAFTQVCEKVCKDSYKVKYPQKNTCVPPKKKHYSDYKLDCTCSKDNQANIEVLKAFAAVSLPPSSTTTRKVVDVITKSRFTTKLAVSSVTGRTSKATSFVGTTTITKAAAAVVTSQVPLTGRIRVDRVDRGKKNDVIGYYATTDGIGEYAEFGYIQYTKNASEAAPVTLDLANDINAYAIRWQSSKHVYWASARSHFEKGDMALGGGKGCGYANLQWLQHRRPLAPLKDQQTELCNPDFPDYDDDCPDSIYVETYIWTLNETQVNKVNPSRKLQVPLRPFYLTMTGAVFRPTAIFYDEGEEYAGDSYFTFLGGVPVGNQSCYKEDKTRLQVAHYFEPDVSE